MMQILTKDQWAKIYTPEEYNAIRAKTLPRADFGLHYAISFGLATETMVQARGVALLTTQDDHKHKKLTPLLIAAMKGNLTIVKALIAEIEKKDQSKLKSAILAQDKYGKTALHHAAVTSPEMYALLKQKAKLTEGLQKGISPESYAALTCPSTEGMKAVSFRTPEGGLVRFDRLTQEDLASMGIQRWVDTRLFEGPSLKTLWKTRTEEGETVSSLVGRAKIPEFNKAPPKLIVSRCKEIRQPGNYELRAGEFIAESTIIAEYAGAVGSPPPTPTTFEEMFAPERLLKQRYTLENEIDPAHVGNAARFANCGWPTAGYWIVSVDGCKRVFLLAYKKGGLKENDRIQMKYGLCATETAFGNPQLFGRDEMRAYFAKGVKRVWADFKVLSDNINAHADVIAEQRAYEYLSFPLTVGKAWLDLHFSGLVKAEEWLELLCREDDDLFGPFFCKAYPFEHWIVRAFLEQLDQWEVKMKANAPLRKLAGKWVLKHLNEYSFTAIMKGLSEIANAKKLSVNTWKGFIKQLNSRLSDYDHLKDPQSCFAFSSLVDHLFLTYKRYYGENLETMVKLNLQALESDKDSISYKIMTAIHAKMRV